MSDEVRGGDVSVRRIARDVVFEASLTRHKLLCVTAFAVHQILSAHLRWTTSSPRTPSQNRDSRGWPRRGHGSRVARVSRGGLRFQ
jgi:hypothetical protein